MSEISRRGFLGLLAAPAIVRADSLMKLWVPPCFEDFVREVYSYNIHDDRYWVRWDVAAGPRQWHVDARIDPVRRSMMARERGPALALLRDAMRSADISPLELRHLPLPQGCDHARRGVPKGVDR